MSEGPKNKNNSNLKLVKWKKFRNIWADIDIETKKQCKGLMSEGAVSLKKLIVLINS